MNLVVKALAVAQEAHTGQKDKNGKPYILHPIRVADSLKDHGEETQAAGLLHDVIEDTDLTIEDLHLMKFPLNVIFLVEILTKKDDVSYKDYVYNIGWTPQAIIIKIADIMDNYPRFERPLPEDFKGLKKRYDWAIDYLSDKLSMWEGE